MVTKLLVSILQICIFPSANIDTAAAKEQQYHQELNLRTLPTLPNRVHVSQDTKSEFDNNSLHDSRSSDTFNLSKSPDFDADSLLPQPGKSEVEHTETLPFPPADQPNRSAQPTRDSRRVHCSPSGSISAQSLVPLPLGPVVLRDPSELTQTQSKSATTPSPTTDKRWHRRSESTQDLLDRSTHQPYFETRESPYQRCSRRSTETLAMRSIPSDHTRHPMPTQTSATISIVPNERPRTGARLQRKRSNHSHVSHSNADDSDVEKEILELNTIVEERRAETNKANPNHSHIPAVAPSMQIRARSETLNDIGSALSRPLATHHDPHAAEREDEDARQLTPRTSKALVSGWLSNVATSTPPPPSAAHAQNASVNEPFHDSAATSQHARAPSTSSSATLSYTLESSPTVSKRYSRSLMITPISPSGDEDGVGFKEGAAKRVGVAL